MNAKVGSYRFWLHQIMGAFADGAVLFPLLFALALVPGMEVSKLLISAGLAYVFAGWFFRIPMSVQPLKSLTVGALAVGASAVEIRFAGLALAVVLLLLLFSDMEKWVGRVPVVVIHALQAGLGVLLFKQGMKFAGLVIGLKKDYMGWELLLLLPCGRYLWKIY